MAWIVPHQVAFASLLSVEACKGRLNGALGSSWALFPDQDFVGGVRGNGVSVRRNIRYRNSFQTIFVGRMEPGFGGTILSGSFRMHAFVYAFMTVWFGFLLFAIAPDVANLGSAGLASIAPLGMVMFGVLLVLVGRFAARNEEQQIADFLRLTLEAGDL